MYDSEYVPDFIVVAGRQVGKSLNLSRSEMLDMVSVPELQLLYVAPLEQQTRRYATLYLNEAIQSCPVARMLQMREFEGVLSDSKIMKAVSHQSLANGAGIQLTYAKTSPDRARGIFADRIDFDEIQDQLVDNVPIISQSLKSSKWGVRKFTGTAKTMDNTIEQLWQKSSMCEWLMKCEHCNHWNVPNKDGRAMDMIQLPGVCCVHCGRVLNVRNGVWVPYHRDRMGLFRGYHMPQIILPFMVERDENWAKILRDKENLTEATFTQECLGISESAGARLITPDDIKRQSTLPFTDEIQKRMDRYAQTFMGVDWGGAEEASFTVGVVIGIRFDGRIDVLYAMRFHGVDPDTIFEEIAKTYNFYDCEIVACDYGLGIHNNQILHNRFGLNVVQMSLVKQNLMLEKKGLKNGEERWAVDKTQALRTLFYAIKYGRVYFPPYDSFRKFTDDLLSPYEHVTDVGGITHMMYLRNPAQPDDFCMALVFALMLAAKFNGGQLSDISPKAAFGPGGALGEPMPLNKSVDPKEVLAHE